MRITIEFEPINYNISLPLHYNRLVQGMIYNNIDRMLASKLHNSGLKYGQRVFKVFTFSRLEGKYQLMGNNIIFNDAVKLKISSIHKDMLISLSDHLLRSKIIELNNEQCRVVSINTDEIKEIITPIRVKAISPITIYSTLLTKTGNKKTYFFSPLEKGWDKYILDNLKRKATALGWENYFPKYPNAPERYIKPIKVTKKDFVVTKYLDTVIKGWLGIYEINLPEPIFLLAYDAGLGAKNSQGFGMIEIINVARG